MKIEGKFYNRTTTQECSEHRRAVPCETTECGEDRKWTSCICTQRVSMHHTHTHLKDCKAEWQNPLTLNTLPLLEIEKTWKFFFLFVQNPSIGQQLPQQSQYRTPSMELHYSNSCQQFSAYIYSTHALTSNWFWVGPQAPQPFIGASLSEPHTSRTQACPTLAGLHCKMRVYVCLQMAIYRKFKLNEWIRTFQICTLAKVQWHDWPLTI